MLIIKDLCNRIRELEERLEWLELHHYLTEVLFKPFWYWKAPALHRSDKLDVLIINTLFPHTTRYWDEKAVVIITHETIHNVLCKLNMPKESTLLDKVFGWYNQSRFLLDGNWKWLENRKTS